MTDAEIRSFVHHFVDCWERRDLAIVDCYEDDCTVEGPIFGTIRGRAHVREQFQEVFRDFGSTLIEVEDVVIDKENQRAALVYRSITTNVNEILGVPGTGLRVEARGAFVFRFRDRRIVSQRVAYSLIGVRESIQKALIDQELKMAADVQSALLPRTCHSGDHFEVAGASLACRAIGGDFFEYVNLPGGDFGIALGDVSGKGPAAALLASMLQGIFSVEAEVGSPPSMMLGRTNRALLRRGIEGRFATVVYGILSSDGRFAYSNAGHNPPLLVRCGQVRRLQVGGPPLGLFAEAGFSEETVCLENGDTLILYTDGVTEAFNGDGDEFGEERLIGIATLCEHAPSALLDEVFAEVRTFCGDTAQSDDVTMIALRYR